jgi:hypothetical protein
LFIQCPECAEKHKGCCTPECADSLLSGHARTKASFGNSRKYRKSLTLIKANL